jgi:hypothetical protein
VKYAIVFLETSVICENALCLFLKVCYLSALDNSAKSRDMDSVEI